MSDVRIADREITRGFPPLVVAEMSGNHNQSLERALAIVDAAADAGAHALKIQTYTADTITLDLDSGDFLISDPDSPWSGRSLYDLYSEAFTPWEWHAPIMERARSRGMIAFSTPFDETAVDLLEELEAPCYKIASFELTHIPLIRACASTGKPLILSTGMATAEEVAEAVDAARSAGSGGLILLKCTSSYPASPEHSDIATIPDMRERFGCEVGISDHTLGAGVALAAVALGAVLIEKHFTLRRADGGVDAVFSMEPEEMAQLVVESERAWQALGQVRYGPTESERASLRFRRSLYVARDMKAGDAFDRENLRVVRPGSGLEPKHCDALLGRRVRRDAAKGTPVTWDLVD